MSLYPTKTRLALLVEVDTGRVFRDVLGDDYIAGERKVNSRIAELFGEDWVELENPPAGNLAALPHWRLTDAGRAVLDAAVTS